MGNQQAIPNKNSTTTTTTTNDGASANSKPGSSLPPSLSSQFSTKEFSQALSYINEFKCFHEYKDFVRCVLLDGHNVDPRCKDIYTKYGYCTMRYMEPLVDDCFTKQSGFQLMDQFGDHLPKGSVKNVRSSSEHVFDIPAAGTENRKKWCFQMEPLQKIMKEWDRKSNAMGEQNAYLDDYFEQIHALEPLPQEQQIKTFPKDDSDDWPEMEGRLEVKDGYFTHPCMRASQDYAECLSTQAENAEHEVPFHLSCSRELMEVKACFEKYHCSDQLLHCANNFEDPIEGYRMCRDVAIRPHLKYSLGALDKCMGEVHRFLLGQEL